MEPFWMACHSAPAVSAIRLNGFALLATLLITSCAAQASVLQPFTARYSATLDLLVDVPVTAERSLSKREDGLWYFSSTASSFVAKQEESSAFRMSDAQISPTNYHFKRSVFGRERTIDIEFQPTENRIVTLAMGEPWTQPWETRVLDKLSYQLQLRADLAAGRTELSYRIADGGQIKTYRFLRAGTERLETAAGTFDCVRLQLDRESDQPQTLIWMAPELDYLTVRLLRIDSQGREHILNLKEYQLDD